LLLQDGQKFAAKEKSIQDKLEQLSEAVETFSSHLASGGGGRGLTGNIGQSVQQIEILENDIRTINVQVRR
jgi:hypothetical protein